MAFTQGDCSLKVSLGSPLAARYREDVSFAIELYQSFTNLQGY